MHKKNSSQTDLSRRDVVKGATSAGLVAATGLPPLVYAAGRSLARPDLIKSENAKPGTRDWMLTKTRTVPGKINKILVNGRCQQIEGYCSANSIRAGEKLQVMVSTNPATEFKLEIFRTGYYGGTGARLVKTFDSVKGTTQPDPPVGENYVRECRWEPSVEFEIPGDWLSGVYLGKLTAKKSGIQSYVIFIVRDDRPCDLLFQCSDFTWSAYNRWPADYSIYTQHKGHWKTTGAPSGTVSFDRPYGLFTHPVNRHRKSGGSGEYLPWEFPLSFWMELHGYDVSYISNVDTHADPAGLLRTKGFISVGHDEYWTLQMYDNAMKARDAGVSLAFFGGNSVLCVVPMLPTSTGTPNRNIRRESWFLPMPENIPEAAKRQLVKRALNDQSFELNMGPDGALLMGGRLDREGSGRGLGAGDWTCATPEHWLFAGTGMKKGDSIKGLVGWEWHGAPRMDLPGMNVVAAGDATVKGKTVGRYTATLYDGPKDNVVFNAATIWWANGLSSPPGHLNPSRHGVSQQGPDKRVQQITHNLFQRFIAHGA